VALSHEHAAEGDQGAGAEPEAFGPEQRADDHVAPGLQLPVHLHEYAVSQAVGDEYLLGLGQAQLPRRAGVFYACPRAGARAAVVSADEDLVGVGLGDARG